MTSATDTSTEAKAEDAPAPPAGRIVSLDSARGLFLCVNIVAVSVLGETPEFLEHSKWYGVTFLDIIFPLFVTLSGCGLAFAYRKRVGWRRTFRRSLVLLVCGLLYTIIVTESLDLATLRFTGPLQVYAVLVLIIGVLHLKARTPRAWLVVTVIVAALQAFFLAAWQAGCPGGELLPTCNPSRLIDFALMSPDHVYASGVRGHDPEGLVAAMGALVTACVGVTAGHLALAGRGTWRSPLRLATWAAAVFVLAVVSSLFLPEMKRLWTTPFALGVAALGVLLFALGVVVMDMPTSPSRDRLRRKLAWPLVALGRNSLLVYFGSHIVLLLLLQHGGETSWAEQLARTIDIFGSPRLSFIVFMLGSWVLVTAVLHRRKIYLRP